MIYINDLCNSLKILKPILYADDTSLFIESQELNQIIPIINEDLANLHSWCITNKLTINIKKTNYILLKNPQNSSNFNRSALILNNQAIVYLKVFRNYHWSSFELEWSYIFCTSELKTNIWLVLWLARHVPKHILIMLYYSFVNSKIAYCLESWGNAPQTYLNKLFLFQKRAMRIINRKSYEYSTKILFKECKILTVFQLYKLKAILKAHSLFHSNTSNLHSHLYPTQNTLINLPIPLLHLVLGKNHLIINKPSSGIPYQPI